MALSAAEILLLVKAKDEASGVLNNVAKTAQGVGSKMGSALKLGGLAAAGGIGVAVAASVKFVGAASNLNESLSKVSVVFGSQSKAVEAWSKTSAKAFGLSQQKALEAAGTFGNLFSAMGLGQKESAGLSKKLVELASDFASFNNIGTDEALEKLRAGLVGEAEPLRSLGININAATVEAKAMELGLADVNGVVSDAAKVQARYALILDQSKNAQGDFARTSEGLANKQRILKAQWENIQATIGNGLLPVVTALGGAFSDLLVKHEPEIQKFAELLEQKIPGAIEAVKGALTSPFAMTFYDTLKTGFETIQPALEFIMNNETALTVAVVAIGAALLLAFTPVTGPIALVAAGIGGIVLGIGALKGIVDEFKTDHAAAFDAAKGDLTEYEKEQHRAIGGLKDENVSYFDQFKRQNDETFATVRGAFAFFIEDVKGHWSALTTVTSTTWAVIETVVGTVIDNVKENFNDFAWLVRGFGSDFATIGQGIADDFWKIVHAVDALLERMGNSAIVSGMATAFDVVRQSVGWLADRVWQLIDAIKSIPNFPSVPDWAKDIAGGVSGAVRGAAGIFGGGDDGGDTQHYPNLPRDTKFPIIGPVAGFATGTPFVPRDGLAYLHRGEAVIPAAQNRGGVNVQIEIANVEGNVDAGMVDRLRRVLMADIEGLLNADGFGGMQVNTAPFAS